MSQSMKSTYAYLNKRPASCLEMGVRVEEEEDPELDRVDAHRVKV